MKKSYLNILKGVPLFSSLSNEQLDLLSGAGALKQYERGCAVVCQNDPGDTFYTVISGSAKVTLLHETGKEIVLSVLTKGAFFGELSLLDDEPRSASVVIVEDALLFLLTRSRFHQLVTTHHDILKKLLKEVCKRLRYADEKIASLAFLDVYGRTLRVLLQLAHDQGAKTGNTFEIPCAPTHEELSHIVGASRETITRIIKVLKENRTLVSYRGRKVVLREYSNRPLL